MTTAVQEPLTSPGSALFVLPEIVYPVADLGIDEMRAQFMPLEIANIDDKKGFEAVHAGRMACVANRNAIEKTRKELKAPYLKASQFIDDEAKRLQSLLAPIEAHLETEESRYKKWVQEKKEAAEAAERAKLNERLAALESCGAMMNPTVVAVLTDEEWAETLAHKRQEAAEKKAAAEAEAAELKAQQDAEAARIRAEQERIAVERAELEKIKAKQDAELAEARRKEDERVSAERAEIEKAKREQAEAQAKIDAEKKRLADEISDRERQEEMKRREAEAAERAKREAEDRQRADAEAKRKREADEQAARERAERLRPDRDKLLSVADSIEAIALPRMTTSEGIHCSTLIAELLSSTAAKVRQAAGMIAETKQPA